MAVVQSALDPASIKQRRRYRIIAYASLLPLLALLGLYLCFFGAELILPGRLPDASGFWNFWEAFSFVCILPSYFLAPFAAILALAGAVFSFWKRRLIMDRVPLVLGGAYLLLLPVAIVFYGYLIWR